MILSLLYQQLNKNKEPDLIPLKEASNAIGSILKGDIVIYESTVTQGH